MKSKFHKRLGLILFAAITMTSVSKTAIALDMKELPSTHRPNGSITDIANILSPKTEVEINQLILDIKAKNGDEIAVVTVPETTVDLPKGFTAELLNYLDIQKPEDDLLLVSKQNDRVEIQVVRIAELVGILKGKILVTNSASSSSPFISDIVLVAMIGAIVAMITSMTLITISRVLNNVE